MKLEKRNTRGERGSALVLALFLIVILTVMGLGLVLRTKVSQAVAGAERPQTKGFYATEAGINAGYARLQTKNPCAFAFNVQDVRVSAAAGASQDSGLYPIQVNVAQSIWLGWIVAPGYEVGKGTALVKDMYRMNANALEQVTQTRRAVEAEVILDPAPPQIPPPCS